ncbi:MAG TPA: FecR domain-containing protein [Pedomonas sp.]|uniref:FecR family protein n=1 Tax=Pedomonas sp. TaxID=2976421 RepID=UPI002F3F9E83
MNGDHNPDAARQRAVDWLLQGKGFDELASPTARRQVPRSAEELEAYQHADEAWEALASLKADPDYASLLGRPTWRERLVGWRLSLEPRWSRRSVWAMGGAAVAAGLVALAWLGVRPDGTVYNTSIAEIRQLSLEDGSTIALGAKSRLEVTFSGEQRVVDMQPGEAFFSVTPDPDRPFVIRAGDTRISVVGTKFNVKYDGENVRVAVTEGKVRVAPPKPLFAFKSAPMIPLEAGKEALITPEADRPAVKPLTSVPAETWLSGWLAYEDVTLREIIADVNRYLPGEVVISSEQLAQERLTASFRADQAGAFLESLPRVVPVRLEGRIGQRVVLTEASSG